MPSLKTARMRAGSVLLGSMNSFCFCGTQSRFDLNSIERIQVGAQQNWKTVPVCHQVAKMYQLAAVSFQNQIILFGGQGVAEYYFYKFNEDGELLENLSKDPNIPGYMCSGSSIIHDATIYAVGLREMDNYWRWRIYDSKGTQWNIL